MDLHVVFLVPSPHHVCLCAVMLSAMLTMDQTSQSVSKPQLNVFFHKSCHGHDISSQQSVEHRLRQKLVSGVGYFCEKPDHVTYWQNVDFVDLGLGKLLNV